MLERLIEGWQTCRWPAAASIFCLDCSVDEDEVEIAMLCLSHRTSSHIHESCETYVQNLNFALTDLMEELYNLEAKKKITKQNEIAIINLV